MRRTRLLVPALALTAILLVIGPGCGPGALPAAGSEAVSSRSVKVNVLSPTRTTMDRITTQPATVHAYFEARVFARAAGYLSELRADIGTSVAAGDVLAVIGIPEMGKQREAKLATIRQMEAMERRAVSQVAVAQAGSASSHAKRDKAKAEVGKAEAGLAAAHAELDRISDLVQQQAVADRLKDEAQKKYDAAAAEKGAAEAAVTSAEADMTLAAAQVDAAKADLDVAKASTDVKRRELEELDEMIKYAKLVAPFDGVVTHRHVDPGDLIHHTQSGSSKEGSPLFVITKLDQVRVRVHVPERDAPLATAGDSARVTMPAIPGKVFEGKISRVAGVLDEMTRTMLVEVDLPNPEKLLQPGMFGQATIALAASDDTLTLPANAVRFDEKGAGYVYVVNASDQIEVVPVQTGLDHGEWIEISAGLQGNERIVGPLLTRLKAGQTVSVN